MFKKIKNWIIEKKKWLAGLFIIVSALGVGSQYLGDTPIAEEYKLKAPKEKILESNEIDDIRCDSQGLNCVNHGKIKSYDYVSEEIDNRDFIFTRPNFSNEIRVSKKEVKGEEKITTQLFGRDLVYKDSHNKIHKIITGATTTIEAFEKQTKEGLISKLFNLLGGNTALATTADYYSGATGDGVVDNDQEGSNWATTRTATDGTSADTTAPSTRTEMYKSGSRYIFKRTFFTLETSPIPDNATFASSTFNVKCSGVDDNDNDANGYTTVVLATQAATTTLSTADYDQIGSVALSDNFDTTNAVNGSWIKYTLNATGLGLISVATTTKLSVREGHDLNNDEISNSGTWTGIYLNTSDSAGNEPYLEVTYTVPAPPDTCTYGGSGNYLIDSDDNCYFTTDPQVKGDIYLRNTGAGLTGSAVDISLSGKVIGDDGFLIQFSPGKGFKRL